MPTAIVNETSHSWAIENTSRKKTPKAKPEVTDVRPAGENHQVVTVEGGGALYRREPCSDCPWRKDAAGEGGPPAEIQAAISDKLCSTNAISSGMRYRAIEMVTRGWWQR